MLETKKHKLFSKKLFIIAFQNIDLSSLEIKPCVIQDVSIILLYLFKCVFYVLNRLHNVL